jgi:dienelactone hydrolase
VPALSGSWAVGSDTAAVVAARDDPFGPGKRVIALQVWFPIASSPGRSMPYMPADVAAVVARSEGIPAAGLDVRTNAHAVPVSQAAGGSFPTVVFSPGFGEPHSIYTALLEDLASHGFVVIALDHTHETAAVDLPKGLVVQSIAFDPRNEQLKRRIDAARDSDVASVLAALPRLRARGTLPRSADLGRIGIFGHSLGGLTTVKMLAEAPQLRCGADVDGSLMQLPSTLVVRRPLLVLTGADGTPTIGAFWPSVRGPRWWFELRGAAHLAFSDWVWLTPVLARGGPKPASGADAGGIQPAHAVRIVRSYLAAFFAACLKGGSRTLLERPHPPYAGVVVHH